MKSSRFMKGALATIWIALSLPAAAGTESVAETGGSFTLEEAIAEVGGTESTSTSSAVPEGVFSVDYGKLVLDDLSEVIRSPTQWSQQDWRNAGIVAVSLIGVGAFLDHKAYKRSVELRAREDETRARWFERMGSSRTALAVLGSFYVAGMFGNAESRYVAQDGVASTLIASAVIAPALKFVVGRRRPRDNEGTLTLRPFTDKNSSFPSGHTTQAFVLASTISSHYDQLWIKGIAYGLATATGAARVYHGAHFASDVVAGALIGTYVGNTVAAYNSVRRSNSAASVSFLPTLGPGTVGFVVLLRF